MPGYLRNAEADRMALRGGWLYTGDMGSIDADGRLAIAGRCDDLIVTGGENVAPLEIERVLDEHPAVAESLVGGTSDDEWGQRVTALVVMRQGSKATAEDLAVWCRKRVASYKVPREFRFVHALPRGATGKVLRREVSRTR
jgi:acyl-CoA synthetase (AMP-forming)/AMP-acid ligase II